MRQISLTALVLMIFASPLWARDRTVSCRIEVNGRTYLRGPCTFSPSKDGSFSIGTGDTDRTPYFAYVNKNDDGTAQAFWNETPSSSHAHTSLGTVRQDGACWVNAHAKVCAE